MKKAKSYSVGGQVGNLTYGCRLGGESIPISPDLLAAADDHGAEHANAQSLQALLGGVHAGQPAHVAQHRQQHAVDVLAQQQRVGHRQHRTGIDDDKFVLRFR